MKLSDALLLVKKLGKKGNWLMAQLVNYAGMHMEALEITESGPLDVAADARAARKKKKTNGEDEGEVIDGPELGGSAGLNCRTNRTHISQIC